MVKEAEAHAAEDKRERERADARNEADGLLYTTEKSLKDYGDKVSSADKAAIEAAAAELKKALEGQDVEAMKAKTEALKQASYKLAEEIYKSAAPQGGPQAGADGDSGSNGAGPSGEAGKGATGTADDVDYRVVDDEDKK